MPKGELRLTSSERAELRDRMRSRTLPAEDVRRARLILLLAEDKSYSAIRHVLGCNSNYISRWKGRFETERLAGLYSHYRGRAVEKRTPALEAKILEWTRRPPPDGSTHWSSRKLARHLGISHMMVARVWQRAGLKPHRIERYMASDDPDFETKAADIIGLYVKPPQHAAVFCVDEKTAIQALDRLDPVLPLSPGRLERHGFEYYRHGTLSLYAALNTKSGEVMGKTAARHTSQEFVAFLAELVANQPRGKEIHLIADNLSAHKTKRVEQFLAAHPKVHLHYTPTYSSWLNQVENWFAKIERDVIARGVFTSVKDLARKLRRYIGHYNHAPKPIKWTYRDPSHRITADTISPVTGH
jgi:transposase